VPACNPMVSEVYNCPAFIFLGSGDRRIVSRQCARTSHHAVVHFRGDADFPAVPRLIPGAVHRRDGITPS
jgi:hypothetical protein